MVKNKYKCFYHCAGWTTPQIQLQFTPFSWGIGVGGGNNKVSLFLGPLAIVLWFRVSLFSVGSNRKEE